MDPNTRALLMGAAGAGGAEKLYIEDVFSTWLYTGNDSTQTITNGIDLSGKGGLAWIKCRTTGNGHNLYDTTRGATKLLATQNLSAESTLSQGLTAFGSTGFTLGSDNFVNASAGSGGGTYASWTFRKAAKFFDVATFTANSSGVGTFSHSLGATPGTVIIKRTDGAENWLFWHRSLSANGALVLNSTGAEINLGTPLFTTLNATTATTAAGMLNTSGSGTYVAYLFAHDAGGFGDSGNDNVISCGSYTGNGSTNGPTVTLGWEPQWVMIKRTDSPNTGRWWISDVMRGMPVGTGERVLAANNSNAELGDYNRIAPTPTGFSLMDSYGEVNASGGTYIYIAIRRGPMKTPTVGTEVFARIARSGSGSATSVFTGIALDALFVGKRGGGGTTAWDKLRGPSNGLDVYLPNAEYAGGSTGITTFDNTGFSIGGNSGLVNTSGQNYINWSFRRAPGFFDVVAYTGNGVSGRAVSHNLTVTPELIIAKCRNDARSWPVYVAAGGTANGLYLDLNGGYYGGRFTGVSPTTFSVSADEATNNNGFNYIAYLFATCPGVSKVGSYTGSSSVLNVDCGFTTGARFVLIKRTDGLGHWFVFDSARGIVSAADPYLRLNLTNAEITTDDMIDPYSPGFSLTTGTLLNEPGFTYIYLAIA